MTVPYYVNEHQSDIRAIKPGWYGMERSHSVRTSQPYVRGQFDLIALVGRLFRSAGCIR